MTINQKVTDGLVLGASIFAVGVIVGSLYRAGEIKALHDVNRELLEESEKKTWYLGKQFAEYIKKKARA
jgi:hypothetical protein